MIKPYTLAFLNSTIILRCISWVQLKANIQLGITARLMTVILVFAVIIINYPTTQCNQPNITWEDKLTFLLRPDSKQSWVHAPNFACYLHKHHLYKIVTPSHRLLKHTSMTSSESLFLYHFAQIIILRHIMWRVCHTAVKIACPIVMNYWFAQSYILFCTLISTI